MPGREIGAGCCDGGGIACTEETVPDGSYAIQRPFVLVTKTDAPLSTAAQAFFDYATSTAAAFCSVHPQSADALFTAAEERGRKIKVQTYRRCFVDHNDPFPISQTHQFFGIRIMGGAE